MKKAPKTPDPYKVADAQNQMNKDTAEYNAALNRIDQSNPYSSITYSQNGVDPKTGAPIYKQNTTYTPQMQSLFDSQIGTQQGIADAMQNALGFLPDSPFDAGDINVDDIRKRSFDSQMANLTPEFEKGWKTLENTMGDRGIPIGAEIWNNQNNEYNRAKDNSLLAASRVADLDARGAYNEEYGRRLNEYNLPFDTLSRLMGNSQSASTGNFSPFAQSNSANTDLASGIWKAYEADTEKANNANSQLFSGLAGLGSMAMNPASAFGYKLW